MQHVQFRHHEDICDADLAAPHKACVLQPELLQHLQVNHIPFWLHQPSAHRAASAFNNTSHEQEALLSPQGGVTAKHCGRSLYYSRKAYVLPQWHPCCMLKAN